MGEIPERDSFAPVDAPPPVRRILLVDDESIVRRATEKLLASLGYAVDCVESGALAVERYLAARERGTPYDLVILDLTMPGGMDGRECLKRLRRIDPAILAVLSSGYADRPEVADPASLGFAAVLAKPYMLETLRATLESLLSRAPGTTNPAPGSPAPEAKP